MNLKSFIGGCLLGASSVFAGMLGYHMAYNPDNYEITDVNGDGVEDIVLKKDGKLPNILINKGKGIYDKTKLTIRDGHPFFVTEKGFYDPWGKFHPGIKEMK